MAYRIAGIDVHKEMLAVVVADVEVEGEWQFDRRQVGTSPDQLRALAEWLVEHDVEEVVMESTAQYWRPVWEALERDWQPTPPAPRGRGADVGGAALAQSQSNRGARGRKKDFPDAERLVKRLVAQELTLSFVPEAEQRLWRTVMRRKYQVTRNRVQLQNRLECLLEEAHIKLSSLVSDLLGAERAAHACRPRRRGDSPAALVALADTGCGQRRTSWGRARRLHRSPSRLPAAPRPHARGIATHRRPPRRARSRDGAAHRRSTRRRSSGSPKCRASASIRRSRSSRKSARRRRRFPPPNAWRRGSAPARATTRAPA